MKLLLKDDNTGGNLLLIKDEQDFDRLFYGRDRNNKYFTIAWNPGPQQTVTIDGAAHEFRQDTLLTLLFNQSFSFEKPEDIIAWQFNREFYCILDHDREVSCVGFLFGSTEHLFINLDNDASRKLQLLLDMFVAEFKTPDHIQNEMLLVLLKRLIIDITKAARAEYIPAKKMRDDKFDLMRKFNLLVEGNFRSEHSVGFYAAQLSKSPKTLSNLFALYNHKTPQQVIQERIIIEAKRLLFYTDKSVKQVTYELGFEDPAYFSNFFKRHTSVSPQEFKLNGPVAAGK
ncbi:helix-turn-helix domain-containing protein [Foetidibacter luteolus]|uniref:helix-turn-helix domain-containing protein n=1 Tax=Foetidibacter luteolus TaxID=2608880 RepID=UPI00129A32BA|nr:helix-turn-helix domain-containing protein [Foetidibacter luteolus]